MTAGESEVQFDSAQEISVDRLIYYRPAKRGGDPTIPRSCDSVMLRTCVRTTSNVQSQKVELVSLGVDRPPWDLDNRQQTFEFCEFERKKEERRQKKEEKKKVDLPSLEQGSRRGGRVL